MVAQKGLKTGLYLRENFENLKGIKTEYVHKEKIQIYFRPQIKKGEMRFKEMDNIQMATLLD